MNELVASHEPASNAVINVEKRTENEIVELSREYSELAKKTKEEGGKIPDRFRRTGIDEG